MSLSGCDESAFTAEDVRVADEFYTTIASLVKLVNGVYNHQLKSYCQEPAKHKVTLVVPLCVDRKPIK